MAAMIADWLSFWDRPNSIYVSARHKDVHYRLIAREIAAHTGAFAPARTARALDYGCGEALHADIVAPTCSELLLCDGAPSVRTGLAARFAAAGNIRVLAPEDVASLPEQSLDIVVLHSVAQYLTSEQTQTLLILFRRLLRPGGTLMVSDIIPPKLAPLIDAAALLRFAAANDFPLAALAGLTRAMFSDYWHLRTRIGFAQYSEAAMLEKLAAAGFSAHRAEKNIGHNQARMAFVARPR